MYDTVVASLLPLSPYILMERSCEINLRKYVFDKSELAAIQFFVMLTAVTINMTLYQGDLL